MQIHELPSASPSASDYIPIDNGTATRKTTLSSIDIGGNEITFTSGDTSSPSSWQTVAVMASNTAANLMNAISKMVANIRWLYNRLGTSSTGTTATTVTGAIAEHSTKIGSAEMGTTATTLTGAIAEVNDSVNTNTEDIATLNSNLVAAPVNVSIYGNNISDLTNTSYRVGNIAIISGYFHVTRTQTGQTAIMVIGVPSHYRGDGYILQRNQPSGTTASTIIPIYSNEDSGVITTNKELPSDSDWCFSHMVLVLK